MSLGAPLGYTHLNIFLELCLRPQSSQVAEPEKILQFPHQECAVFSLELQTCSLTCLLCPSRVRFMGLGFTTWLLLSRECSWILPAL